MPHICISKMCQHWFMEWLCACCSNITWTIADLLSIGCFRINFSEIEIKIQNFSLMKMDLKMLSVKWQPFCPRCVSYNTMLYFISKWNCTCTFGMLSYLGFCMSFFRMNRHNYSPTFLKYVYFSLEYSWKKVNGPYIRICYVVSFFNS